MAQAGIPFDLLVAAHGNFDAAHVVDDNVGLASSYDVDITESGGKDKVMVPAFKHHLVCMCMYVLYIYILLYRYSYRYMGIDILIFSDILLVDILVITIVHTINIYIYIVIR